MKLQNLLPKIIPIVESAGQAILEVYARKGVVPVTLKPDHSPLTEADMASHQILIQGLQRLIPELPVLSEESQEISYQERCQWTRYWLIDPLDGTKEFLARTDEFSINIALIQNHKPILGVIYLPVFDVFYMATQGDGAYKQESNKNPNRIMTTPLNPTQMRLTLSRRHHSEKLKDWLARFPNYTVLQHGSALKICLVAEGLADLYPRFGNTSEWDTAAGQCVLEEAGGALLSCVDQKPMQYNTKASLVNTAFLAVGDKTIDWFH